MPKNEIRVGKTRVVTAMAMWRWPGLMTDIHHSSSTATHIYTGCITHHHHPRLLGLCMVIGALIIVLLHLIKRAFAVHHLEVRRPQATTSLVAVVGGLHPLQGLVQRTLMETKENIANEIGLVKKRMSLRDSQMTLRRSGNDLSPKLQMRTGEISVYSAECYMSFT